jgi:hypothetical protein
MVPRSRMVDTGNSNEQWNHSMCTSHMALVFLLFIVIVFFGPFT